LCYHCFVEFAPTLYLSFLTYLCLQSSFFVPVPFWVEDRRGKSDRFRIGTVSDLPGFIVTVDEKDANAARLVILQVVAAAFAASRGPPPQAMKL
jgi:hypothetical protein